MIFDTHIHLNEERILENLDKYLLEAKNDGVVKFLCVGWDLESSKLAVELASKYENIYAAIAIMPTEHEKYNENSINELEALLKTSDKIVAIGEIGLDYYWEKTDEIKAKQQKMFIEQINLANKYDLPLTIHARDAIQDTYDILKAHPVKKCGVLHCYSGSVEMAREFIKLGFKLGIGGTITFKNSKVNKEVVKAVSIDDIVFETDAPYLAPMPYRGKLNEPRFIKKVPEYISEMLNIDEKVLEDKVFDTSCKIFHVKHYE